MTLKSFLYLTQLEEYNVPRIKRWLAQNPHREVKEIKQKLIWTTKIKFLNIIAKILFFLAPPVSISIGIYLLAPLDFILKYLIVLVAYIKLRIFHRRLTIVAITGSWGKTTTKDTLLDLIKSKYIAFATTANHNTLLGVCQDIISLPLNSQFFIAEIGAYYSGDIRQVAKILRPKYAIITAIGPMHLERFGTIEKIIDTKMELPQTITQDGWIFIPDEIKQKIFHIRLNSKNILFFNKINDVYQQITQLLNISDYKNIVSSHPPSDHRLQISTNNGITIIDDTYNSNPAGFERALTKLAEYKSTNKILITPGMIELGNLQEMENTRLIKMASKICQHIVVVGQTNKKSLLDGLRNTKSKIHLVNQTSDTLRLLPTITTNGAVVLFENDLPDHYL
ncbi:MAG: Mur ligase family protein [Microgenomates group bacterium]